MRPWMMTMRLIFFGLFAGLLLCALARACFGQEGHEHDVADVCEWTGAGLIEKCLCKCRQRHCDEWRSCNALPDPDRAACQTTVEKQWERCQGSCTNA